MFQRGRVARLYLVAIFSSLICTDIALPANLNSTCVSVTQGPSFTSKFRDLINKSRNLQEQSNLMLKASFSDSSYSSDSNRGLDALSDMQVMVLAFNHLAHVGFLKTKIDPKLGQSKEISETDSLHLETLFTGVKGAISNLNKSLLDIKNSGLRESVKDVRDSSQAILDLVSSCQK